MLQSSQDFLNIVLASAIALVAVFLAWMLAEVAVAFHQFNRVARDVRRKIERIESALFSIREKLEYAVGFIAQLLSRRRKRR